MQDKLIEIIADLLKKEAAIKDQIKALKSQIKAAFPPTGTYCHSGITINAFTLFEVKDVGFLKELAQGLPIDLSPIIPESGAVNYEVLSHLFKNEPELWLKIAPAVTITREIKINRNNNEQEE